MIQYTHTYKTAETAETEQKCMVIRVTSEYSRDIYKDIYNYIKFYYNGDALCHYNL